MRDKTLSSYRVKYRSTGKVQYLFFRRFLRLLTKFSFQREDWALGTNSTKLWDYLDIFLFRKILSLSGSATFAYHFITYNHASFPFCWKENLLNHQKVSKYWEHYCRCKCFWSQSEKVILSQKLQFATLKGTSRWSII